MTRATNATETKPSIIFATSMGCGQVFDWSPLFIHKIGLCWVGLGWLTLPMCP